MARAPKCCTYKRTTLVVCLLNLVVACYVSYSLCSSFYASPSSPSGDHSSLSGLKYTDEQIKKVKESIRIRQASEPVELVGLVKKLEGVLRKEREWELSPRMKQNLANEIMQKLKGQGDTANVTRQIEAVEQWHTEKLEALKSANFANLTSNSSIPVKEAKMLEKALESDWLALLEDIGLWIPADVIHKDMKKPENEPEIEEEDVIPGRPVPPECHAQPHTDYDGAAVRWGLTHHKETAADCCQACLDQAKRAKPGEMKCNIWVYCPSEGGCYSPDIYEHKHQECWLKQAATPTLNFKDKYPESYRNTHPNAPVVVPWVSGVVGA